MALSLSKPHDLISIISDLIVHSSKLRQVSFMRLAGNKQRERERDFVSN